MSGFAKAEREEYSRKDLAFLLLTVEDGYDDAEKEFLLSGKTVTIVSSDYKKIKEKAFQYSGKALAKRIKRLAPSKSTKFCKNSEYCERLAWFKEQFELIEEATIGAVITKEGSVEFLKDNIGDAGDKIIDATSSIIDMFIDVVLEYGIPLVVFIKIIKYGLDDLCEC